MKAYIADRDFNEIRKGQRIELEDDHPYVRTGYLIAEDDVEELAPEDRPVVADEAPDTDRAAFEAEQQADEDDELGDDLDEDEEEEDEPVATPASKSGAGSGARSRGRR